MNVKILTLLCISVLVGCNGSNKSTDSIDQQSGGVYEGVFIAVNDTIIPSGLDPNVEMERRMLSNVHLTKREDFWGPKSNFYLHGMGSIKVQDSGFYHIKVTSAGGILFKFDNVEHIDHKIIHDKSEDVAKVFLDQGYTIIEYEYFSGDKEPHLVLEWSRDGETYEVLPDSIFDNLDYFTVPDWKDYAPDNEETQVPDNTLTEQERADGWKLLFDGETTKGWHTYNRPGTLGGKWKAQDGVFMFEGRQRFWFDVSGRRVEVGDANKRADGGEDIVTDEYFENFELVLEWKITEAGNSGIFYTVQDGKQYDEIWKTSPEMQVMDNQVHKDGLINKHRAGDLYDLIASDTVRVKPHGQWNTVRIIKDRGKIEHWLNGKMVLSYDLNSEAWKDMISKSKFAALPEFALPGPGRIGIQDHDNRVYYKNIKIRKIIYDGNK
jgi:hypothetical protein